MNGQRPGLRVPPGQVDPLFGPDGKLRAERLTPTAITAVRVAALLAAARRTEINRSMLLYGLAVAGSDALHSALREQGPAGTKTLQRLSQGATKDRHFSSRTRRTLERVATAIPGGTIDDTAVLCALLSETTSSARELLRHLGVDPDLVLRSIQPPDPEMGCIVS